MVEKSRQVRHAKSTQRLLRRMEAEDAGKKHAQSSNRRKTQVNRGANEAGEFINAIDRGENLETARAAYDKGATVTFKKRSPESSWQNKLINKR